MKNKDKLIEINQKINTSNMRKNSKFDNIIRNINSLSIQELYETIVELCLQYHIDCETLIDASVDFDNQIITESEFRKMLYVVLVL